MPHWGLWSHVWLPREEWVCLAVTAGVGGWTVSKVATHLGVPALSAFKLLIHSPFSKNSQRGSSGWPGLRHQMCLFPVFVKYLRGTVPVPPD